MERGPLQDPKLAKLSTDYVACRMTGGSQDRSKGIDEFMSRYNVQGFPTLLVLSADGGVLAVDLDREPDAILAAVAEAGRTEADFQAFKAAVGKSTDPALRLGLAQLHLQRKEFGAAIPILKAVAEKDPAPHRWRKLAEAQQGAGQHADALASLDRLVALDPSPASHGARAKAQAASGDAEGAIGYLKGIAAKTEAAEAKGQLLDAAAGLVWQQCADKANAGEWKAAVALLDRLLKEFPGSSAAGNARQYEQLIRQRAGGGGEDG